MEAAVKKIGAYLTGKTVIDTTNPIADAAPVNGVLCRFYDRSVTPFWSGFRKRCRKRISG